APIAEENRPAFVELLQGVKVFIGLITCYVSISLVMQTKDDFRFVIPYVEFAKETRGSRPTLLDTSVLIDGRVLDILETGVMQGELMVPRFVLDELQTLADEGDKLKRARGRRGLDMLQKLQDYTGVQTVIDETQVTAAGVDHKLIELAEQRQARIMTNDFNLNKVATLRGIDVINLNDLAKAMRPVVLPGEEMTVKLVKPGENPAQGVGYLEDGTMVVVENGRDFLQQDVDLVVTSTLQTSAGRMIFGRCEQPPVGGQGGSRNPRESQRESTRNDASSEAPAADASEEQSPAPTDGRVQTGGSALRRGRVGSSRNPRRSG
ncbi:MAG: PIN/TRAM domain-containing protein, partial [Phycisphaeraceae bacterium]